jgi:hypothetical protein
MIKTKKLPLRIWFFLDTITFHSQSEKEKVETIAMELQKKLRDYGWLGNTNSWWTPNPHIDGFCITPSRKRSTLYRYYSNLNNFSTFEEKIKNYQFRFWNDKFRDVLETNIEYFMKIIMS